ncbi:MAG TPA: UDP-N-acetylglucosamine 2-epimerase (non-hydrolyzing) [Acidimicrobiales bacterium]|nr:UDP-N-acetylglucosamine 2-epimerase (non-hydrolyzing) [Acidimicrobiales bacterium]
MKVVSVVGARPQFVKAAVVGNELRRRHHEVLVHTGQHYDREMSEQFFSELHIPLPDYDLKVGSGPHGRQTGAMLAGIEEVLVGERPDHVLVYGDTNSTVAGALAAAKLRIPVGHVEAGLRSFDRNMPEEINRVVTDHVSSLLFAPTPTAVGNLRDENVTGEVHAVGDVMLDVLLAHVGRAAESEVVAKGGFDEGHYFFATLHRAENVDPVERLRALLASLGEMGAPVAFPVHPRTRARLDDGALAGCVPDNVALLEPLGYVEALAFQMRSIAVLTDSGGVQREAAWLGVPCMVLRDRTEWPELLDERTILAPLPHEGLARLSLARGRMAQAGPKGSAAGRITAVLSSVGT